MIFSPIPSHSSPISQDFQQFQKAYSNVDEKGAAMTDKINVKKLAYIKKKKALIHLSIFLFIPYRHLSFIFDLEV